MPFKLLSSGRDARLMQSGARTPLLLFCSSCSSCSRHLRRRLHPDVSPPDALGRTGADAGGERHNKCVANVDGSGLVPAVKPAVKPAQTKDRDGNTPAGDGASNKRGCRAIAAMMLREGSVKMRSSAGTPSISTPLVTAWASSEARAVLPALELKMHAGSFSRAAVREGWW
jgi:hypothetical protein